MAVSFSSKSLLASLALLLAPALFAQTKFLEDKFNDGSRTNLAPTTSAAWFTSAAGNTVFTNGTGGANGTLALDNGSSRTMVGYFTANGTPVTMGSTDTLTLDVLFNIDAAALAKSNGIIFGLLQSVANPAAVSGTGFTAPGARVSGDFASSNPTSHVFGSYTGYAAWTNLGGGSSPVTIRKHIVTASPGTDGLDNASASWTQIGSASGTGTAPAAGTDFHAILTLTRTAGGAMAMNYTITQNGATLVNYSSTEAVASSTTFDTVNVYMASGTLTGDAAAHLVLKQVNVTLSNGALPPPPTITTHPASQTVNVGANVDLIVAASGTGPFTYAWSKNGGPPIAGATGPTFSILNVQPGDAGDYVATVTNAGGSTPSNPGTLTVVAGDVAPSIGTPPASQTVSQGSPVTFSVVATGTPTLTYQWFFEDTPIDGATASSLLIGSAQPDQAGHYTVSVTNSVDTVTSAAALLTVIVPPTITTQPIGGTVDPGTPFTFTVAADGTAPFTYVWKKNGIVIPAATASSFMIGNVQPGDAGNYTVVVTNSANSATSLPAFLNVNAPPVIVSPPASQLGIFGGSVSFTVVVSGTAPFTYEWSKNGTVLPETSATLTLSSLQASDAAGYTVKITNAFNFVTSSPAVLTLAAPLPNSAYNLYGFATLNGGTTGGGVIAESDPGYFKVTTPLEFATAIALSNKTAGAVKVIEIMNDLNLGWNEIGATVQGLTGAPFRAHTTPKLHPTLIASGVSVLDIKSKSPLTIFSANGATIKHVNFNLKGTSNIMIRNLKFDEMWEWDESSKGNYDDNDWDFITLSNGSAATNIWIDHCTFTKAYDGITDFKAGTQYVTFSWCRYLGDDGATNLDSSVRRQINALEANRAAYAFYNFLRTNGFSVEDIVTIIQGHDKGHLLGSNSLDAGNNTLSATFHHQWFQNLWDRCVPRLRGGNVHDYNIYVDDVGVLAAKRLRDLRANALSTSLRNTLNNTYSFNPPVNGSISTEGGALLLEKSIYADCLTPLRNNQTDVTNPVYTGKILGLDSIYSFHNTDSTTTVVRGNSTDAGNPLGPFQAPVIPFSWNGFATLPYSYTLDDPTALPDMLAVGAGAGRVVWSKDNWLRTVYADSSQNFATWAASKGLTAGQDGATQDPDIDGINNLLEYFLGLNPTVSNPTGLPTGRIEGSNLAFRFPRSKLVTGATYRVLTSSDLVTWTPVLPAPAIDSTTADVDNYLATVPLTSPRLFARLEVTLGATVVATVPVGYENFSLPGAATTVFGLPLDDTSAPPAGIRAGRIEAFTANTLTQSGGGWTSNLASAAAPWLLRITSGPAAGKWLDIASNSATTLTLSGADLTTLGLTAGVDTFELVPMDTLLSLLGTTTLQGGASAAAADTVQVRSGTSWLAYYFDTNLGFWRRTIGPATNSNNVPIRPQSGVQVLRRGTALTLTFTGRVPAFTFRAPINNASTTAIHSGFPTDTTLGALGLQTLLPGWQGTDQVALYNGSAWVSYVYNGSFWQPATGPATNSDSLAIPAGTLLTIQRPGATPGTTDLVRLLPYSL